MTKNFLYRLRRMSVAEILYRVLQKITDKAEKALIRRYRFDMSLLEEPSLPEKSVKLFGESISFADDNSPDLRTIIEKADRLCENRFDIFALRLFRREVLSYGLQAGEPHRLMFSAKKGSITGQ